MLKTLNMFVKCLIFVFILKFCACSDTIRVNQVFNDGDVLISQEGNFTFGFFSPGNSSLRYVGIWFHKVPLQTVVWVANRDSPINGSSGVLSINSQGNLVLYDGYNQNRPLWSTNISMAGNYFVAQLLDSGNLVLVQNESKRIAWQSFDYPTDTLLSGMKIGLDKKTGFHKVLTSWKSADNPGTGEYSFKLNTSGEHLQYFLSKGSTPYWRMISLPWITYKTDDYTCYTISNEEEHCFSCAVYNSAIIRIQLDHSGYVKRFRWQNNRWNEFWSVPRYRCEKYGECGAFSKCNAFNIEKFQCTCLPGYEPKFPSNWYMRDGSGGCIRKQKGKSLCEEGEGFAKLSDVRLPDTSVAQVGTSMSRKECEQACVANCSCTAYASLELPQKSVCLMWYGELIDLVEKVSEGYDIYVRVAEKEITENERNSEHFLDRRRIRAILVASIVSSWLIIMILIYLRLQKTKERKVRRNWKRLFDRSSRYDGDSFMINELEESRIHADVVFFTPNAILAATNNFSPANKIGEGGFGSVYKGQLSNGKVVAVKKLFRSSGEAIEEFKNELLLIAKLQHRNLVKIIGCCIQGEEPMLIYEYLPNSSLDSFLFDETRKTLLDWIKRFNIIVGIARGLLYLHQDSRLRIIHRDLKSSNILLDGDMNPKISDFGSARIARGDQDRTKRVVGTYGYMSPEYVALGKFSVKSDVFSFGVILMEVVSSKKRNEYFQEDASQCLIGHVWELWREGRALEIIDSSMILSDCSHEVLRCIQIALLCVQEDANDRPTMSEVVVMLNGEAPLPSPKQPAFTFGESSENFCLAARKGGTHSINEVTITAFLSR